MKWWSKKLFETMNSIDDLPAGLLAHIFSFYIQSEGHRRFLKNIPLVCKRWNDVHSTSSLWSDMDTAGPTLALNELNKVGERGFLSSTKSLGMRFERCYVGVEVIKLFHYCRNLKELNISGIYYLTRFFMDILAVHCLQIESLKLTPSNVQIDEVLCPFLKIRGQTLKRLELHLELSVIDGNLIPTIAKHCHSLEKLAIFHSNTGTAHHSIYFPIDEIGIGCPKLRELTISHCCVSLSKSRDHKGFENMVSFAAFDSYFRTSDLHSIFESFNELESLTLRDCGGVKLSSILRISSDKLKVLVITGWKLQDCSLSFLEGAMKKWKRTLTELYLPRLDDDVTEVLEKYLYENSSPKLQYLDLKISIVSKNVLKSMWRVAENLQYVRVRMMESTKSCGGSRLNVHNGVIGLYK